MKQRNINLHIEELALHGFAPNDRYAIADAVQRELSQLFAAESVRGDLTSSLIQNAGNPRLNAKAFQVEPNSKANSIGTQIARAVHGGLFK